VREALDTNPDANRVAVRGLPAATAAALRAPDEPAPVEPVALNGATDSARRAVGSGNGAARPALPASAPGAERDADLFDDEELDLLDDLDDEQGGHADDVTAASGTTNGSSRLGGARVPGGAVR
jgi:hypothetical protein